MSSVAHDPGYKEWESSPTVVERVSRAQDGASGALRIRRYVAVGGQVRYSSVGAMLQTGEVDGFGGEIRLDGPSAVTVIIGNGVEPFRHDYDFVDFEVALVGDGLERAPWSARSKTRDQ